jgi:hypothetical protein
MGSKRLLTTVASGTLAIALAGAAWCPSALAGGPPPPPSSGPPPPPPGGGPPPHANAPEINPPMLGLEGVVVATGVSILVLSRRRRRARKQI